MIQGQEMEMSPDMIIFIGLVFCYFYVLMSEFFAHKKCNYIHETAVAILLGALFGLVVYMVDQKFFTNEKYESAFRSVTILILLPPMLFEDGYNIRKRKFFQNIMYINLYGLLGTVINFATIFGIVYLFNYEYLLSSISNQSIVLRNWQILAFASVMCSIDTVVPEKIVNPERYPKLFSIIFGESIFKDTIAVTLFDTIINSYKKLGTDDDIRPAQIGFIFLTFLKIFACSIVIGIISGIITTLMFKHLRFLLTEKGVAEVALVLLTGYSAYILSEWASMSGVISMLFCGITLSHFNVYNLSDEGRISAKITVSMLALVAEGLLFFMLGIMMFDVQFNQDESESIFFSFSWNFLLVGLAAILVARFLNIYLVSLVGWLVVGRKKWRLNRYEYQIMYVSGLVKGAIPFALILGLPNANTLASSSVQNTTILIVFFTSFILNSIMPKFLRNRQCKLREMIIHQSNHPSVFDSLLVAYAQENDIIKPFPEIARETVESAQMKGYLFSKVKNTTQKYWRKFEEGFIKPKLIYDYYARREEIKKEKLQQRKQEAEEYWKRYHTDTQVTSQDAETNKQIDLDLIEHEMFSSGDDGLLINRTANELFDEDALEEFRNPLHRSKSDMKAPLIIVSEAKKETSKTENIELGSLARPPRPVSMDGLSQEESRRELMAALRDDLLERRSSRSSRKGSGKLG